MQIPPVRRLGHIVWPFAIAETILWAAFYYSFPALLPEWESDLGFSKTQLSAAFTAALVLSAVLAPLTGRLIDRGHALRVFMSSAILGAMLLIILSTTHDYWQFFTVWIGIGITMSGALYEACFAIVTRVTAEQSKQAITRITLVAGLAGTISFPAAHTLTAWFDWRVAIQVFAATVILIAVPLIWYGCHNAGDQLGASKEPSSRPPSSTPNVLNSAMFWLLAISFTAIAINHGMLLTHLLPILGGRGINPELAVFAAAMIGPMQVTGRIAMMMAERRVSTFGIAIGCFLGMAAAALVLRATSGANGLVFAFVILQGAAYGVTSIVRPVITAELLGRQNFGAISGLMAVPFMFGYAAAPMISAVIWAIGGYDVVILTAFAMTGIGLTTLLMARHSTRTTP